MVTRTSSEVMIFDLYGTLVDPLAIAAELAEFLPVDLAQDVAGTWRQKQIEYSFRLTMMQRYQKFDWVTERALDFALLAHGAQLSEQARRRVLDRYDAPQPYPDVEPALSRLARAGYASYVLSNGSPEMLQRCLLNSGLADYFHAWLSVDAVGAFKPVSEVYQHAGEILGRRMEDMRLISCNPFDVIGGKAAGMRTAWVNRSGGPFDTIGEAPDMVSRTLTDLADRIVQGGRAAGDPDAGS